MHSLGHTMMRKPNFLGWIGSKGESPGEAYGMKRVFNFPPKMIFFRMGQNDGIEKMMCLAVVTLSFISTRKK